MAETPHGPFPPYDRGQPQPGGPPTPYDAPYFPVASPYGAAQGGYVQAGYGPPVGRVRDTGLCILLTVVTFGIYPFVWYFQVHGEMKRHSGHGVDGGIALILALFAGVVMPFITSSEVGGLYERRGQARPVSGATGLWFFPGSFLIIGPLIWFVLTNGALNAYWRSLGVR